MLVLSNPHDSLFRALVEDGPRGDLLIREHLPSDIVALLAEVPLRGVDGSFIDEALRQSQSDRLFEATLKDGRDALIYVLLEHKSYPDPDTPLQILRYMVRIWTARVGRGETESRVLPAIIPLVFYHGARHWNVPLSVADMIDAPEPLAARARSLAYVLHDLGHIEMDALSRDPALRSGLAALKHASDSDVPEALLRRILSGLPSGSSLEIQVIHYIVSVYATPLKRLQSAVQFAKPENWEVLMSTVAEVWVEKGEARGLAKGKAEGKSQTLLRLLECKFDRAPRIFGRGFCRRLSRTLTAGWTRFWMPKAWMRFLKGRRNINPACAGIWSPMTVLPWSLLSQ